MLLPRAWLVGEVKSVKTQRESLMETLLGGFDPRKVAIVNNYNSTELPKNVEGEIVIKSKTENRIELESNSETEVYLYYPRFITDLDGKHQLMELMLLYFKPITY